MKLTRHFILLASLWTLSGCGPAGDSYPTPIPPDILPTAIIQTAAALNATAFALHAHSHLHVHAYAHPARANCAPADRSARANVPAGYAASTPFVYFSGRDG
jgi:hypothetical protein